MFHLSLLQWLGLTVIIVSVFGAAGAVLYTIRSNSAKEWREASDAHRDRADSLQKELNHERSKQKEEGNA